MSFRNLIVAIVLAAAPLFFSAGLFAEEAKPLPPQAHADNPMNQIGAETSSGTHKWIIDLASDQPSRSRGLMFVNAMPQNRGMLFRFDQQEVVAMWMKNTFIPLDMIFMTESGEISYIHRGAVPHSRAIISSRVPARYVLELNAGEAARAGLKAGQKMRHPWFKVR